MKKLLFSSTVILLLSTSCVKTRTCECFRSDGSFDGKAIKSTNNKQDLKKFEDGCRSDSEKRKIAYGGYCTLS